MRLDRAPPAAERRPHADVEHAARAARRRRRAATAYTPSGGSTRPAASGAGSRSGSRACGRGGRRDHATAQRVRPAEQRAARPRMSPCRRARRGAACCSPPRRPPRPARRRRPPNPRRAPSVAQRLRRPGALAAEVDVVADDDVRGARGAGGGSRARTLRARWRRTWREALQRRRRRRPARAAVPADRAATGCIGGARSGASTATGCGWNVSTTTWPPQRRRLAHRALDDRLMPAMHAVEVPERQHRRAGAARHARQMADRPASTPALYRSGPPGRSTACASAPASSSWASFWRASAGLFGVRVVADQLREREARVGRVAHARRRGSPAASSAAGALLPFG